jgi:hypothetical protein
MSNWGKVGKCDMCGESKLLVSGYSSEGAPPDNSVNEWLICIDCQNTRAKMNFRCSICDEHTTLPLFKKHLIKHTVDQLAGKIYSDKANELGLVTKSSKNLDRPQE